MRTAGTFEAETLPPPHSVAPAAALGWKSTVPIYLFGGLAAMLGLIAFALLILACSYWKLSGYPNPGESADDGKPDDRGATEKGGELVLNSVLVIMAGDQKPTFLATATPAATSRASSIGGGSSRIGGDSSGDGDGRREKEVVVELSSSSSMRTTM